VETELEKREKKNQRTWGKGKRRVKREEDEKEGTLE
jgi:hypothetical protein